MKNRRIFNRKTKSSPKSKKNKIRSSNVHKFLNQSGCLKLNGHDDAHNFEKLMEAFDIVRIRLEDLEHVFNISKTKEQSKSLKN
ncbi:hypothetical protein L1887_24838 [Cichorium endivia]|nr:hypothetical protein L1887_24838 [Cichorium endivia]